MTENDKQIEENSINDAFSQEEALNEAACLNAEEKDGDGEAADRVADDYGLIHKAALFAFILAFWYSLICGFDFPCGFQVPLVIIPLALALDYLIGKRTGEPYITTLILTAVFSLPFAVFSNYNVLTLTWLVIIFYLFLTLLRYNTNFNYGKNMFVFIFCLVGYVAKVLPEMFRFFKQYALIKKCIPKIKKIDLKGNFSKICFSLIAVILFSALFSAVNQDFADLCTLILDKISEIIDFLLKLDIIEIIGVTVFLTPVLFALFTQDNLTSEMLSESPASAKFKNWLPVIASSLKPLVLICLIFVIYQSEYLFQNPASWSFKDLTLYVQKGFWELLEVSFLAAVLYECYKKKEHSTPNRFFLNCLFIFLGEFVAISLLTEHKVFLQPLYFGLKDLRIFAFFGVALIVLTFVLYIFEMRGKISSNKIFKIQYIALTAVIAFLSFTPIDYIITKLDPIRYEVNGTFYKDYSYLLTNSADNYSEWPELFEEYERINPPQPLNYYWGRYKPLTDPTGRFCDLLRNCNKEKAIKQNLMTVQACAMLAKEGGISYGNYRITCYNYK